MSDDGVATVPAADLGPVEELSLKLLDPAVRADPYPVYARLRAEDPVHRSPLGFWVLTRYEDATAVLRDTRFRTDFDGFLRTRGLQDRFESSPLLQVQGMNILFKEGPAHSRLQKLVGKGLTSSAAERMRDRVQHHADELIDAVAWSGSLELIRDLAYPLPLATTCEMYGFSAGDRERLSAWFEATAPTLDIGIAPETLERADAAIVEVREYMSRLIEDRRRDPQADLLGALIAAEEDGDRLTDAEIFAVNPFFGAGLQATMSAIGNGVLALLRHPDQLDRLRRDLSLLPAAVEETLRYDAPAPFTIRSAKEEVEVGGKTIRSGDQVIVALGAANRDPEQFPDPDRFDLGRRENRHLGFGGGTHFCLGASVARLEIEVALATVVRRLPGLRPAGAPEWRETFAIRGLKRLPLAFDPDPGAPAPTRSGTDGS